MLTGLLYDANDSLLIQERQKAEDLCRMYNNSPNDPLKILTKMLGSCGIDPVITAPFYCDYGYNIIIGDHFYANRNLVILDCAKVIIGNHVMIGPNCTLAAATHPSDPLVRRQGLEYAKEIIIEDDVWLGAGVIILPGVTIKKGSVIGAGSVVTKDIPEEVIAYGNPCKVIKKIKE